jgi:pyruvate dehydrogenase kinase 2/3/4
MEKAIRQLEEFCECQPELRAQLRVFWDQLFVTRIGTRVLAEHFLSCLSGSQSDGVVTECEIEPLVRSVADELTRNSFDCYGTSPEIAFDVSAQGTAAQVIPGHLRYIVQEVMKNSIRATIEQHGESTPPVKVCIHEGTFDVLVKISDMGGGMSPEVEEHVFDYGFSTAPRDTASYGVMGGYGVGLPLSRLYARYFGGDLEIHHMYGHGCTVAIHMNRLGTTAELDISSDSDVDHHVERKKSSRRSLRHGDHPTERKKNGRRLMFS